MCDTYTSGLNVYAFGLNIYTFGLNVYTNVTRDTRRLSRTGQTVCVRVSRRNKSPHPRACLDFNRHVSIPIGAPWTDHGYANAEHHLFFGYSVPHPINIEYSSENKLLRHHSRSASQSCTFIEARDWWRLKEFCREWRVFPRKRDRKRVLLLVDSPWCEVNHTTSC